MEHLTRIHPRQTHNDPYIPECSCGWRWDPCSTRAIALEALELHRANPDTDMPLAYGEHFPKAR